MRFVEKQAKIEDAVYEAIEEIADEIGLNIPHYPEVYWVGKNFDYDSLGFTQEVRTSGSLFDDEYNAIFIGDDHLIDISEESAHFLHFANSGFKHVRVPDDKLHFFSLNTWVETLGFLGSKFVCPERRANYRGKDLFFMQKEKKERKLAQIERKYGKDIAEEFYKYQQAMNIGEAIYFSYLQGKTTKKFIRELFKEDFSQVTPFEALCFLKFSYCPPKDESVLAKMVEAVRAKTKQH